MLNGMAGSIHIEDFPNSLTPLKYRSENPGQWFLGACDGKFTDEDLNEDGNAFAKFYYPDSYPCDLESMFKSCETLYHVPDTWGTYDVVAPIIDKHYHAWLETRNPSKSWWKFW